MSSREQRRVLASLLGLQVRIYGHDRSWTFYDGKTLHVSRACTMETVDHEIGHFLGATLKERKLPEWGLGRGPEFPSDEILEKFGIIANVARPNYSNRTTAKDNHEAKKESTASLYGIAVSYTIGAKNEWREHANLHQWDRAAVACDLFCLISDTEHYNLKNGLTKVLARLAELKGRL